MAAKKKKAEATGAVQELRQKVDGFERSDFAHLVRAAIQKVGGLRELSRQLDWHSGAISEVLAGKVRLPPYRAGQCATVLGLDPNELIFESLQHGAKTEGERRYWFGKWHRHTMYGGVGKQAREAKSVHELAEILLQQLIVDSTTDEDRAYWKARLSELERSESTK